MRGTKNGSLIVLKKELKLLFKSKRRVFLLVITPIILLIVGVISGTSFAYETNKPPVSIQILDESPSNVTASFKGMISTINHTEIHEVSGEYGELINQSNFQVFVYIPANFTDLLLGGNRSSVFIHYSSSEYLGVAQQVLFLSKVFEAVMIKSLYPDVNLNLINPYLIAPDDTNSTPSEDIVAMLIIIPIYAILFIIISPLGLILISVTIEREQKTLEVLFLQPVQRKSIVLGKIYYGLVLIFLTLILDIIAAVVAVAAFIFTAGSEGESIIEETSKFLNGIDSSIFIGFVAALIVIALLVISASIFLSLLAKDEREANMIAGIFPILIVMVMSILFVVPFQDFEPLGQALVVSLPLVGVIIAIYLSGISGGVTWVGILSLVMQCVWTALTIHLIVKVSEAESILELSYGKVFRQVRNLVLWRKR